MKRMTAAEYVNASGAFDGMKAPASKYRNRPTIVDGVRFASKAEARRWDELRMLEKAGEITDLKRQVAYPLYVNDLLVGSYVSDFDYLRIEDASDGGRRVRRVVEDVKGVQTPLFRLKAKMFEAFYSFPITIIGGARKGRFGFRRVEQERK